MSLPATPIRMLRATLEHLGEVAPLFDLYRQVYGQQPDLAGPRAFGRERLEGGA